MKAVTFIASPHRKGNCSKIVEKITEGIKDNGGENNVYFFNDLDISPCQACASCRPTESKAPDKCIIKDDFIKIMDEAKNSDAFIFAAPNYFGEFNAQAKTFIDRFYSMTQNPNTQLNNTKGVFIFTYGAPTGTYDEYVMRKSRIFESIGLDLVDIMSIGDGNPNSNSETSEEVLKHAYELGKKL